MIIQTCGVREVEQLNGNEHFDVISIRSPGNRLAALQPGWGSVTFVALIDTDTAQDPTALASIVKAVRAAQQRQQNLLIHCEMGVSRSVGVAYAVADCLQVPFRHAFNGNVVLKMQVRRALLETP